MATLDPTVRYLVVHPTQAIVHDGLLTDQRDNDTRACNDWHQRNVETRFRMVGQARPAPGVQAGVALHRTGNAGRYESNDIGNFSILQRHLARSLAIGFRNFPNSHLDIDIQYPGLQHRTTYALTNFFNGVANKVQQQELKKNEQTAVP